MSLNAIGSKQRRLWLTFEEIGSISHIEKLFSYINEKMKFGEYNDTEKKEILLTYKKKLAELNKTFKGSSTINQEKISKLENIFKSFPIDTWIGNGQHDMFRGQETENLISKYIPEDKKELFVKILSLTSIKANTASNLDMTFRIYISHLKGNKTPKTFGNINEQLKTIFNGGEISGNKITNFQNAMLGDKNAVVIDSHIARKLFGIGREKEQEDGKKLTAGLKQIEYLYCELIIREIALKKGFTPNQISCILQYTGRTESNSRYNTSYYQYFDEKIAKKYTTLKKYNGINADIEKKSGTASKVQETLKNDKNFEVLFGQKSGREKSDIIIRNTEDKEQSLLEFCREQGHSPYFIQGNGFYMRPMTPLGSPKEIIYHPDEIQQPGGIVSFLHELGECIRLRKETIKENKIEKSKLSPTEKKMELKKLTLKRQIECRYLAIQFGKDFQKRGYNVFHGFSSIKDLEHYINRFIVTYMEKAHYALEKKDCLVDSQKIAEIMNM